MDRKFVGLIKALFPHIITAADYGILKTGETIGNVLSEQKFYFADWIMHKMFSNPTYVTSYVVLSAIFLDFGINTARNKVPYTTRLFVKSYEVITDTRGKI